jgi:hypothetical protein
VRIFSFNQTGKGLMSAATGIYALRELDGIWFRIVVKENGKD